MNLLKYFYILLIYVVALLAQSCESNNSIKDDGLFEVNYIETDTVIVNPERGFYSQVEYYSSSSKTALTAATVNTHRYLGRSLILTMYYLDSFIDKPISNEFLTLIDKNMKAIREGGCKCIVRFAYTSSESKKPWDAPQNIVLEHIQQLAPYLRENSDVIYVVQAGFVGVWGEWYYTSNFIMSPIKPDDFAPRRAVLDALLLALPKDRMICVRTPEFKVKCFNITYADSITELTAYSQTDLARLACHNDCFLADGSDMGTFPTSQQKLFWEKESKYTVMGGETCAPSTYSQCENAILQMEKYHWSYLNSGYNGTVLNSWKTTGCMDEINRRLGYRFVLQQGQFTENPVAGQKFTMKLTLKNVGFASPANPRNVELIFASSGDTIVYKLKDDPRRWYPGIIGNISFEDILPFSMKGKSYNIYLNLPDPYASLATRSEYSIGFANKNVWNKNTGFNKLHSITVN